VNKVFFAAQDCRSLKSTHCKSTVVSHTYVLCLLCYQARLHAVQIDPTTYTAAPAPEERYNEWLPSFDLENSKGVISELLVSNVEIRALYTQLVSVPCSWLS